MAAVRCCTTPTKAGLPCRAAPLPGKDVCLYHDPDRVEQHRAAYAAGARKAGQLRSLEGRLARLDTPSALLRFVGILAHRTLAGEVNPDVCRAVAYCVSIQRQLIEAHVLERRLRQVEERLTGSGAQSVPARTRWG